MPHPPRNTDNLTYIEMAKILNSLQGQIQKFLQGCPLKAIFSKTFLYDLLFQFVFCATQTRNQDFAKGREFKSKVEIYCVKKCLYLCEASEQLVQLKRYTYGGLERTRQSS